VQITVRLRLQGIHTRDDVLHHLVQSCTCIGRQSVTFERTEPVEIADL